MVALLALAGTPPLSLWATKDAVLAVAFEHSPALYVVGLLGAALAAAYAVKALVVLLGPPSDAASGTDEEEPGTRTISPRMAVAMAPLGAGALTLGVLAWSPVLESLLGAAPVEPSWWELAVSGLVVVVAGGLTAALLLRPRPELHRSRVVAGPTAWLHAWLGLEAAVTAGVVRPVLRAAGLAARLDDRVLARAVDRVAAGVLRVAGVVEGADDRGLARGVQVVAVGTDRMATSTSRADRQLTAATTGVGAAARRTGRLVRRSSRSGQLHHYYLQLVAGVLLTLTAVTLIVLVGSQR